MKRHAKPHPKKLHGRCDVCGHYGDDCFGYSPAEALMLGRCLANVQRLQSEFWQSLRDLEAACAEVLPQDAVEPVELNGAKDFNDFTIDDILAGHANDGKGGKQ